jgi:cytochrome c553
MPRRPARFFCLLVGFLVLTGLAFLVGCSTKGGPPPVPVAVRPSAAMETAETIFAKKIRPFISTNCLECHDNVGNQGDLALDKPTLSTVESMRTQRATWERVLGHVSRSIMPPSESTLQPTPAERTAFVSALDQVLHPLDSSHPDAGRVVLSRLNREEYKNTVQDILGVAFNPAADFPADDSGYGYDNIGDVLTLSPLLFERYLAAARAIAREVVPERLPPSRVIYGSADQFKGSGIEMLVAAKLTSASRLSWTFTAPATGNYKITTGAGSGVETPSGNLHYNVEIDGVVVAKDFETADGLRSLPHAQSTGPDIRITKGPHTLVVDYYSPQRGTFWFHFANVEGPFNPEPLEPNAAFVRLVGKQRQDETSDAWINRGVTNLATPLLRRAPTNDETARLAGMFKSTLTAGGTSETGWQTALQAVLVSPSFLFRGEPPGKNESADKNYALSEPELASRLSYFLWSSAPDERLRSLATQGQLRANLTSEIRRLLTDPRAERFVRNFAGQWLHLRNLPQRETDPKLYPNWNAAIAADMAVETQKFFADFLANGRPIAEMLTADYSFVSPLLAKFYGINPQPPATTGTPQPPAVTAPPAGPAPAGAAIVPLPDGGATVAAVPGFPGAPLDPAAAPPARGARGAGRGGRGAAGAPGFAAGRGGRGAAAPPPSPSRPEEFVRVTVPPERRAGLLGQASILALSSYANRTSPVLRGKFVLDSLLGTAPPPPPANVPGLPETAAGNQPATVRERLALHRAKPQCAICHKDIDPIGFALENFDATGAWRTSENGLPVDSVGELPTGEKFSGAVELGRLLAGARLADFQKNFAAQLLTYALGRGTDYYDRPTLDEVVTIAGKNGSTLPAYIEAVANSLAFQQRRGEPQLGPAPAEPAAPAKKLAAR